MSTREPLESKQCPDECQAGFNRLRCYAAKVWCKALKVFEPLCKLRNVEFSMREYEQMVNVVQASDAYERPPITKDRFAKMSIGELMFYSYAPDRWLCPNSVTSEFCSHLPKTRKDYAEWLKVAQAHGFTFTADEQRLARGQLTGFNIIGLAMAYGTTCHCCLGWRAIALGVIGFVAGALIF